MIKFFKNKNIFKSKKNLVLDIIDLVNFLGDEDHREDWKGVSFQFNIIQEELALLKRNNKNIKELDNEQISLFSQKFLGILALLNMNEYYIQQCFTKKLFPWFRKNKKINNIYAIKPLYNIFQSFSLEEEEVKGYISLSYEDLKSIFKSLFFYSFITHSQDLFIISQTKPVVIILNNHLTIDVVTSESQIFNQVIEMLSNENIEVKIYR